MSRWHQLLGGRDVVCMASGPSLTKEDTRKIMHWRQAAEDRAVIVTNTTFRLAPWADVLYAMDRRWWMVYMDEIKETFKGQLATNSGSMCRMGWKTVQSEVRKFKPYGNSGAAALSLALKCNARRVVLLGYDCKRIAGKVHHHGDHPKGLGNAKSMPNWPHQFGQLRRDFPKAEVLNASRDTDLKVFPLVRLEDILELESPAKAA